MSSNKLHAAFQENDVHEAVDVKPYNINLLTLYQMIEDNIKSSMIKIKVWGK